MLYIGNQRECFFDDYFLDETKTGAEYRLHNPIPQEVVLTLGEMWEGDGCDYYNFFYDKDRKILRLYYLAFKMLGAHDGIRVCYAESRDGLKWEKPELGLFDYKGTKHNNIILDPTVHKNIDNFMVFYDDNPACPPDKRYKAIASYNDNGRPALYCFWSEDGIRFSMENTCEITDKGAFDSLNVAFWDENASKYRCYFRSFHQPDLSDAPAFENEAIRDIRYIESPDFVNWSEPVLLDFKGAEDIPLYTNNVIPYYRAPHIYIGSPSRYIERKSWTPTYDRLCGTERRKERMNHHPRYGLTLSDCVFMCSRDGKSFKRYDEAFIRPGPERPLNWVYGDCYPARGLVETPSLLEGADPEISIYNYENHWSGKPSALRRYTIRRDGFVSLHSGAKETISTSKRFVFEGAELEANLSTSARGYIRFVLRNDDGEKLESYEIFGDSTSRIIDFDGDISKFSGKPIYMDIIMSDADLYSIKFN